MHSGRSRGGEERAAFLAKPTSQQVIAALEQGMGVREAARATGVSINTVHKVAGLLKEAQESSAA